MEDLILVGSGGCMREILWQLEEQNKTNYTWNILGYIDKEEPISQMRVKKYAYLGDDTYLLSHSKPVNVAICIGSPQLRKRLKETYSQNPHLHFPTIIMKETVISDNAYIEKGTIVCSHCIISNEVTIGEFSFINMNTMICHDSKIGSLTTISPGVNIAGNVTIGTESYIGIGTNIIQGITLGEQTITGAGSVVVRSEIGGHCTLVGVPASKI